MKRIVAVFITLLLIPGFSLAAPEPMKIGVLACLTGNCAEWGNNTLKGLELAQKEINTNGGILGRPIELVIENTNEGERAAETITAFRNLYNREGIRFFIGPTWSIGGVPLSEIIKRKDDVVMCSPSLGVAKFNEAAPNLFNVWPHDAFATERLAEFAIEKGWKKAAIMSTQNPWEKTQGDAFEREFKERGGKISIKLEPLPEEANLRSEVLRIVKSKPDMVFFSHYNKMDVATRMLKEFKYEGPILAILMDQTRVKGANGALEGAYFASYPDPEAKFIQTFKDVYGEKPGITADTAYDTLNMFTKVFSEVNSGDVRAFQAALLKQKHRGASGNISFDKYGGVKKDPIMFQVSGLEYVPLEK